MLYACVFMWWPIQYASPVALQCQAHLCGLNQYFQTLSSYKFVIFMPVEGNFAFFFIFSSHQNSNFCASFFFAPNSLLKSVIVSLNLFFFILTIVTLQHMPVSFDALKSLHAEMKCCWNLSLKAIKTVCIFHRRVYLKYCRESQWK